MLVVTKPGILFQGERDPPRLSAAMIRSLLTRAIGDKVRGEGSKHTHRCTKGRSKVSIYKNMVTQGTSPQSNIQYYRRKYLNNNKTYYM